MYIIVLEEQLEDWTIDNGAAGYRELVDNQAAQQAGDVQNAITLIPGEDQIDAFDRRASFDGELLSQKKKLVRTIGKTIGRSQEEGSSSPVAQQRKQSSGKVKQTEIEDDEYSLEDY